MASADALVALFSAITQNLRRDQAHINQLDSGDNDTGDNMVENFDLVTRTLSQALQGGNSDVGAALGAAAQALSAGGRGATAPIYAEGLAEAGQRLAGQQGFSLTDLLPLLQGLMAGTQRASGTQQGDGGLVDVLLPGILAYMQAKGAGRTDQQALMEGLLNLRRGANSTAGSGRGYGSQSGRDTRGQIDPGAAGAASLLEGLFGALLSGALSQGGGGLGGLGGGQSAQQEPEPTPGRGLGDLIGGIIGGQPQPQPQPQPRQPAPQPRPQPRQQPPATNQPEELFGGDLLDQLGRLFGGGTGQQQPRSPQFGGDEFDRKA